MKCYIRPIRFEIWFEFESLLPIRFERRWPIRRSLLLMLLSFCECLLISVTVNVMHQTKRVYLIAGIQRCPEHRSQSSAAKPQLCLAQSKKQCLWQFCVCHMLSCKVLCTNVCKIYWSCHIRMYLKYINYIITCKIYCKWSQVISFLSFSDIWCSRTLFPLFILMYSVVHVMAIFMYFASNYVVL